MLKDKSGTWDVSLNDYVATPMLERWWEQDQALSFH